ncbi:hypothetical protein KLVA111870_25755 [Klebsiella variicola]|nr:Uncharacterised protein [Klebsiella pneumoniae]VGG56593.1 Uncharacterised protein [Klebsiella pneumoniae]
MSFNKFFKVKFFSLHLIKSFNKIDFVTFGTLYYGSVAF